MRLSELIRRPAVIAVLALGCLVGVGLGLALAGGEDEGDAGQRADAPPGRQAGGAVGEEVGGEPRPGGPSEDEEAPAPEDEAAPDASDDVLEREAERAVRDYVAALVARDGERACALFEPGALDGFKLPVERGDCADSLDASIGYRDPRGYPQWNRAKLEAIRSTEVSGEEARVTATIVSDFADRDEPSVEDDVVYLRRSGDRWLIAAPSAILYRAVGAPDVPPQVLAPPG